MVGIFPKPYTPLFWGNLHFRGGDQAPVRFRSPVKTVAQHAKVDLGVSDGVSAPTYESQGVQGKSLLCRSFLNLVQVAPILADRSACSHQPGGLGGLGQ